MRREERRGRIGNLFQGRFQKKPALEKKTKQETPTKLTCRVLALTPGLRSLAKSPDISRLVPNCLVAASSLEATLTLGDRYEASILYSLPIAPSIAQPTWRPNPILTPNPGRRS